MKRRIEDLCSRAGLTFIAVARTPPAAYCLSVTTVAAVSILEWLIWRAWFLHSVWAAMYLTNSWGTVLEIFTIIFVQTFIAAIIPCFLCEIVAECFPVIRQRKVIKWAFFTLSGGISAFAVVAFVFGLFSHSNSFPWASAAEGGAVPGMVGGFLYSIIRR
jgi:hypothetical protein